jgi:hypothetical protein
MTHEGTTALNGGTDVRNFLGGTPVQHIRGSYIHWIGKNPINGDSEHSHS